MIGDRVDTDVAGAAKLGIDTALVLSGVAKEEDVQGDLRPNYLARDLLSLVRGDFLSLR